jgi:hypothetical protein
VIVFGLESTKQMFTRAGLDSYTPPPCGRCAAPLEFSGDWIEITTFVDPEPAFVPGRHWCTTPRCGYVCKVCRGEIGDVHGPHCGELMLSKIERPHIIDRSDCT